MSVLRVVVTRSGGFAGLVRTVEVDDPAEAEQVTQEVRAAFDLPVGRARDGFVYAVTIVTETATEEVELQDAQVPPSLRALVR